MDLKEFIEKYKPLIKDQSVKVAIDSKGKQYTIDEATGMDETFSIRNLLDLAKDDFIKLGLDIEGDDINSLLELLNVLKGRQTQSVEIKKRKTYTAEQKKVILDEWKKEKKGGDKLDDFLEKDGVKKPTFYSWKKKFDYNF